MEDTSLDDYLENEDSSEGEGSDEDSVAVEPATSTSQWFADGRECDTCGEAFNRLWTDDDGRVCRECKNWG